MGEDKTDFMTREEAEKDPTVDINEHPPIWTSEHFEPEEFESSEGEGNSSPSSEREA